MGLATWQTSSTRGLEDDEAALAARRKARAHARVPTAEQEDRVAKQAEDKVARKMRAQFEMEDLRGRCCSSIDLDPGFLNFRSTALHRRSVVLIPSGL